MEPTTTKGSPPDQGSESGVPAGPAPRQAPLLITPPGWTQQGGAGFALTADAASDDRLAFAFSVARGLEERPRVLEFRWLYDDHGSHIFERITEQPEYYQTRTEDGILARAASSIRELCGAQTLVELGSGSSTKTRRLLDAWCARGPSRYVPIDVSPGALEPACRELAASYPELSVEGIAASYERALPLLGALSPLCLMFLGSSIGNLDPRECDRFLALVAGRLAPGDHFLVGLDLVKDPRRLEAAYNDAAGWSAAFTSNLFARMDRELGTRIDPRAVQHVAFYDERLEQIEIDARFNAETIIDIPLAGRRFRIAPGEQIRTEISRKFRIEEFAARAARFGLEAMERFVDPEALFGVLLLRRRPPRSTRVCSPGDALTDAPPEQQEARLMTMLDEVRRHTLAVVAPLTDAELVTQHSPLMSPMVWDLAHIARYEELWLVRRLAASSDGDDGHEGALMAAGGEGLPREYDALLTPRKVRGTLDLPSRAEALALLDEVRVASSATLHSLPLAGARHPLRDGGFAHHLVAQHEAQHAETMLAAIQLLDARPYTVGDTVAGGGRGSTTPTGEEALSHHPATKVAAETILVPAGPFLMGTDDRAVAYDNERPRHEVTLPAFRIDAAPVTNGAWLRFLDDGGYARRELWSTEGWSWRSEQQARAPGHWIREETGRGTRWLASSFGHTEPLDPDAPVVHVSWYEADAFARWAGKRLPTEAEWEKAASWDAGTRRQRRYPWGDEEPSASRVNLADTRGEGSRAITASRARTAEPLTPRAAGSLPAGRSFYGCHQMLGDVWEWTSTWFAPYPGFRAFPYREYSEVFFGERYRVLRGGSFATLSVAARCTFRNWDFPERRQIFSGLRCCEDA